MTKNVIFDYSMGSSLSLTYIIEQTWFDVSMRPPIQDLVKSTTLVLHIGSFALVAKKLEAVKEIIKTKFVEGMTLGISFGQLLFETNKDDFADDLTFFKDKTIRLHSVLIFSHIDWTTFNLVKSYELFNGVNKENAYIYCMYSLYPMSINECVVCTKTTYGITFTSAIVEKNMYSLQFHQEKSGDVHLQSFAKMVTR